MQGKNQTFFLRGFNNSMGFLDQRFSLTGIK